MTYPHALADALALIRTADAVPAAAAQVAATMTEAELAEMVCNLTALVLIARDTGRDLTLDQWSEAVLLTADTPY